MQDPSTSTAAASTAAFAKPTLYGGHKTAAPLHLIIIGCGLGGLAAAHTLSAGGHAVTLLEAAPQLGEVGAGIQVSPNVSRLLIRWGLGPALEHIAVRPTAITFRRYSTGERVGYTTWGPAIEKEFDAPYYHIHRADFHRLLYDLVASDSNTSGGTPAPGEVKIRLNAKVTDIDPDAPSVTLESGDVLRADLIIGADGVKSCTQAVVTGSTSEAVPTGDAAYRAIIPADVLLADPELREFIETPEMCGWMAPGRHLMAYPIRGKKEYNLVLLHPDDGSVESWTAEGSADKMRADFADFEPRVQKMLSHVTSTLKWRLMDRQPLERWVSPSGKVALLGDSCHPMLPYRAQGAAMAIEDAALLGALFSRLERATDAPALLRAYQDLRLPRTADTQRQSRDNQTIFHLPDGPEQAARDAAMREAWAIDTAVREGRAPPVDTTSGNPNAWADKSKSARQFGYDPDVEAERWWAVHGAGAGDVEVVQKGKIAKL